VEIGKKGKFMCSYFELRSGEMPREKKEEEGEEGHGKRKGGGDAAKWTVKT
jgi:hypothetical protein